MNCHHRDGVIIWRFTHSSGLMSCAALSASMSPQNLIAYQILSLAISTEGYLGRSRVKKQV